MNRLTQYTLKITTPTANWNWLIHKCKKVCRILYFKYYVIVKSLLADCLKQIKKCVEYCSRKHELFCFSSAFIYFNCEEQVSKIQVFKIHQFFRTRKFLAIICSAWKFLKSIFRKWRFWSQIMAKLVYFENAWRSYQNLSGLTLSKTVDFWIFDNIKTEGRTLIYWTKIVNNSAKKSKLPEHHLGDL